MTTTGMTRHRAQVGAGNGDDIDVLRLIADPLRAQILELLAAESLCVCHLQDSLGARQTLVSHHLRALRQAGLVEAEQAGRFTYYRLAPGAFDGVRDVVGRLADASNADTPKRSC